MRQIIGQRITRRQDVERRRVRIWRVPDRRPHSNESISRISHCKWFALKLLSPDDMYDERIVHPKVGAQLMFIGILLAEGQQRQHA